MTSLINRGRSTTKGVGLINRGRSTTKGVGLVFFRHTDLRLHDHEPLARAHANHDHVLHCFCFDPRVASPSATVDFSRSLPKVGWLKTNVFRAKFLLESVADLQSNLQSRSHQLLIQSGTPESILPDLVQQYTVDKIYTHEAEAPEEEKLLSSIEEGLSGLSGSSCTMQRVWGNTLYHIDDLPFDPRASGASFPPTASNFRTSTEKKSKVRPALKIPSTLKPCPVRKSDGGGSLESGGGGGESGGENNLPSLADLVGEEAAAGYVHDPRSSLQFIGGETAALARMKDYFFDQDCLKDYFHTRNGMLGANYSSKFAPWLSAGCLSPRLVYENVCRYESERIKNKDTYWMLFELNVRDYFRYYVTHWQSSSFHLFGPKGRKMNAKSGSGSGSGIRRANPWSQDLELFERWRKGTTGNPMVDANMRELEASGFMSNRGRQIVASYLTRDLNLDWRLGAMHFESMLIDHDPCSNWGNWTYAAGVGSDPREDRYFNIAKQTKNYDPEHKYIRHWVEEMKTATKGQLMNQLTRGCRKKTPHQGGGGRGSGGGGGGGNQKKSNSGRKGKNKNKY